MNQDTKLTIDGMHCDACVRRVREALDRLPGVAVKEVKVGEARVERDPSLASDESLRTTIEAQGFELASAAPV